MAGYPVAFAARIHPARTSPSPRPEQVRPLQLQLAASRKLGARPRLLSRLPPSPLPAFPRSKAHLPYFSNLAGLRVKSLAGTSELIRAVALRDGLGFQVGDRYWPVV